MWGTISKVRNFSGITKEEISDERMTQIIQKADKKTQILCFKFKSTIANVLVKDGKKIQIENEKREMYGDANFDNVIDKNDIIVKRIYSDNGFIKKEVVTVNSFDPENSIIEFVNDPPENTICFELSFYINEHKISQEILSDASSLFASADAIRILFVDAEKNKKADEFEKEARNLIIRPTAGFV